MANTITKLTNVEEKFLEHLRKNRNEEGDKSFLSLLFSATIPNQDTAMKRLISLFGDKYNEIFKNSVILFESEDSIYVGKYKDVFWGTWSEGELYFCAKEIQNICSSIRDCLIGPVDEPDYKEEVIDYFQEQFNIDYDKYIEEYKDFCLEIGLIYDENNIITKQDEQYFINVISQIN